MKDKGKETRRRLKKVILVSKIAYQTLLSAYNFTNPIFQFPNFIFPLSKGKKFQ